MPADGSARAFDDDADLRNLQGLLVCLEGLPDPRRRRGIRHRAAVVLAFAVVAVMAGEDSGTVIAEWSRDVPPEVLDALDARGDRRGGRAPPSRSTFRRVLRRALVTADALHVQKETAATWPRTRAPITCSPPSRTTSPDGSHATGREPARPRRLARSCRGSR